MPSLAWYLSEHLILPSLGDDDVSEIIKKMPSRVADSEVLGQF